MHPSPLFCFPNSCYAKLCNDVFVERILPLGSTYGFYTCHCMYRIHNDKKEFFVENIHYDEKCPFSNIIPHQNSNISCIKIHRACSIIIFFKVKTCLTKLYIKGSQYKCHLLFFVYRIRNWSKTNWVFLAHISEIKSVLYRHDF